MAETNLTRKSAKLRAGTGKLSRGAGCQSDYFDNQNPVGVSKTAALSTVIQLRPTTVLTTRKRSKRANAGDKRTYLTEAEVERLIKAADTPRDKAMILIGYRHGLRVSELVNLRWRRIDLDAGRIQSSGSRTRKAAFTHCRGARSAHCERCDGPSQSDRLSCSSATRAHR